MKFTESGGIKLATRTIALDGRQAMLEVEVIDSGLGIDPEKIDLLFDRFSQADVSIARRFGGTGLGLSIARQLVELMGGQIGARANEDRGSTFWFRVPLPISGELADDTAEQEAAPIQHRAIRALLADDHATNRMLISALLAPHDIQLDVVENGEKAVHAAGTQVYDLILMDMQMPVMDGLSATRTIRAASGPNQHTPIIALSANILPEHVAKCLDAGMQGHVAKPIEPRSLFDAISTHCWAAQDEEPEALVA